MRKRVLVALFLLSAVAAKAQKEGEKFLMFRGGCSVPVGNFGNTSPFEEGAGFAKTGAFADITIGQHAWKNLGALVGFRARFNNLDVPAVAGLPKYNWYMLNLSGGIYQPFDLTANGKFGFEFREQAGLQFTHTSGSFNVRTPDGGTMQLSEFNGVSPSFTLGAGFTLQMSDMLSLKLLSDYTFSRAMFHLNNQSGGADIQVRQNTASFDLGAGLALRL
ncbi:MAG: hypothetical protein INR69_05695 [Mucilaginibacter polytrichastri]|nr:hypothetical protein [Mucilaginibacter polytrichastri]